MSNYTKQALMDFIETSINKGWINLNTGGGVRAACRQILVQVGPDEDVRQVDVGLALKQFANRNPGKLSGDSLRVYESRVRGVIENFTAFVTDPVTYKPATKNGLPRPRRTEPRNGKDAINSSVKSESSATAIHHMSPHAVLPRASASDTSLTLPFPLRPDFLAQITVPRDMTKDEAKRLAVFIDALAQDRPSVTN